MQKTRLPIKVLWLAALLAIFAGNAAYALDIRSVAHQGVVLYQAPQDSARKLFVISRNTPLEVLSESGDWVRVRDRDGALAWMHKADLSTRHFVQTVKTVDVHQRADTNSPVLLQADKDVLLELLDNNRAGWLKVKHRDGAMGYVRIEEVWGV